MKSKFVDGAAKGPNAQKAREGGRPIFTGIVHDLTDRKRAEEVLRESEQRYRSLFENMIEGYAYCRILFEDGTPNDFIYLEVNSEFESLTGLKNVTGKKVSEVIPGIREANPELIQTYSRVALTGKPERFETYVDSLGIWFSVAVYSPAKEHFVAVFDNITEKTHAAEALQASELRYRRLFESSKDGILILDAGNGQIVDVNPFLIAMLGYSKEEFVGKELWEIGVFKDVVASKAAFVELQRQGYIRYENLPLETRGGLVKQVEFVSNSYLAGRSRVIQCNIRDITEHKRERQRAEEALRETNRHLEQALDDLHGKTHELTAMTLQFWQASKLATMGELAASVAHELNNPLATMALRTEMLVERSRDESSRTSAQIVLNEVERMASLVENLLQFSRRSYRQISTVDVADEISNSVNFISYYLRNRRIKIVTEFAANAPTIQADRQQLRQLFLNLLTNAADAMPDGGTLITRTAPTKSGAAKSVLIEFVDSGEGISDANLERIWDSFFTTKPEGKGTGLGLAICRRIAEEHGGTIAIDSKEGEGTRVRITLPATANCVHQMNPEEVLVAL